MSDKPLFTYVEPSIIATRITTGACPEVSSTEDSSAVGVKKDYAVIDVRDEDEFSSGHVAGAHHAPCDQWQDPAFVSLTAQRFLDKDEVVVHCAKSQQRGPACARLLAQALEQHSEKNEGARVPAVRVLRGGFNAFAAEFEGNETVIEKK